MEIKYLLHGALVALLATGSSVALAQTPAVAHASSASSIPASSGSSTPAYSLTYSEQTFVLTPGSTIYNKWKAWIDRKNTQSAHRHSLRNDGTTSALDGVGGVGKITITIQTPHSPDSQSATTAPAPSDNGPPMRLPPTGTPGEHITFVNHTNAVYQRWTYEWQEGSDHRGPGGWVEIRYQGNSCSPGGPTLCELMAK